MIVTLPHSLSWDERTPIAVTATNWDDAIIPRSGICDGYADEREGIRKERRKEGCRIRSDGVDGVVGSGSEYVVRCLPAVRAYLIAKALTFFKCGGGEWTVELGERESERDGRTGGRTREKERGGTRGGRRALLRERERGRRRRRLLLPLRDQRGERERQTICRRRLPACPSPLPLSPPLPFWR